MEQERMVKCPFCKVKAAYYRKIEKIWVCYYCRETWTYNELTHERKILDKAFRDALKIVEVEGMVVRHLVIPEERCNGDKTIFDDIAEILNQHGRFQIVRNSLAVTIMENAYWKEHQEMVKKSKEPVFNAEDEIGKVKPNIQMNGLNMPISSDAKIMPKGATVET